MRPGNCPFGCLFKLAFAASDDYRQLKSLRPRGIFQSKLNEAGQLLINGSNFLCQPYAEAGV